MPVITVKVRSGIWCKAGELQIVCRIARCVIGDDEQVKRKTEGYKWDINQNTWWAGELSPDVKQDDFGKYKEIEVAFRYGTDEFMKSLEVVLNFVFN
jgi:hypothetical protein